MDGHFHMDERLWREKVRRFELKARGLMAEREKLRKELDFFHGRPSADEAIQLLAVEREEHAACRSAIEVVTEDRDALRAENKELANKVGGLKMTLGRYQKEKKERG